MTSFYGGPQGASMVITKRYDAIEVPEDSSGNSTVHRGAWYACNQDLDGQLVKSVDFYVYSNSGALRLIERNEVNKNYYPHWYWLVKDGSQVNLDATKRCLKINLNSSTGTPTTIFGWESLKPIVGSDGLPVTLGIISQAVYTDNEYATGMVNCFKKGGASTSEVGFGQYVLIDTSSGLNNPSDPDNGKIYRRGLDYQYTVNNPLCGAEYLGRFNGAKGECPELNIDSVDYIESDKVIGDKNHQEYSLGRYVATEVSYSNTKPSTPTKDDICITIDETTTPISVLTAEQYDGTTWVNLLDPNTKFNIADLELIKNNYINSVYENQYVYVKEKSDNYAAQYYSHTTVRPATPTEGQYFIQLPSNVVSQTLPYEKKSPDSPTDGQFWIYQEQSAEETSKFVWVVKQYSVVEGKWNNIDSENILFYKDSFPSDILKIENVNKYILVATGTGEGSSVIMFAQIVYATDRYIFEQYTNGAWVDLTSILTVTVKDKSEFVKAEYLNQYIYQISEKANTLYKIEKSGEPTRKLYLIQRAENNYIDLLPGKYSVELDGKLYNKYHDSIEYAWCNVKDEQGNVKELLMGFKFPFPIFEWDSVSVDPYYHRSDIKKDDKGVPILDPQGNPQILGKDTFTNEHLLYRTDDAAHPFYQAFKLHIPNGKHGLDTKDFEKYKQKQVVFNPYRLQKVDNAGYGSYTEMQETTDKMYFFCTDRQRWYIKGTTGWEVQKNHRNLYYPVSTDYQLKNVEKVTQGEAASRPTTDLDDKQVYYAKDIKTWYQYNQPQDSWSIIWVDDYTKIPSSLRDIFDTYWFYYDLNNKLQVYHVVLAETSEAISETEIYDIKNVNRSSLNTVDQLYADYMKPYNLYKVVNTQNTNQYTIYFSQYKDKELNEDILNKKYTALSNEVYDILNTDNSTFIQVVDKNNTPLWIDYQAELIDDSFNTEIYRIERVDYERFAEGEKYFVKVGDFDEVEKVELNAVGDLDIYYKREEDIHKHLQWISDAVVSNQEDLIFYYNDGTVAARLNNAIKKIEKIYTETDINKNEYGDDNYKEGSGDQRLHIQYNIPGDDNYPAKYEEITVGAPINYIMDSVVTQPGKKGEDEEYPDYHFLVLYSDPVIRKNLADDSISCYSPKFNEIRNDWVDLGYVRGCDDNFRIAGVLPSIDELKPTRAPEDIMNDKSYAGWSFIVDDSIYSYDYRTETWKCIYTFSNKMEPELKVYVDNVLGSDTNNGSYSYPYKTIEKALKNKSCAKLSVYLKGENDAANPYQLQKCDYRITNNIEGRDATVCPYWYVNSDKTEYFISKTESPDGNFESGIWETDQASLNAAMTYPDFANNLKYVYVTDSDFIPNNPKLYKMISGWPHAVSFKSSAELPTTPTEADYGNYYVSTKENGADTAYTIYYIDKTTGYAGWYYYNNKDWSMIYPESCTVLPLPSAEIKDKYYYDSVNSTLYICNNNTSIKTDYVEQQYILNEYTTPVYTFKTLNFINNTKYPLEFDHSTIQDLTLTFEKTKALDIEYSTLTRVHLHDPEVTLICNINDDNIVNTFEDCEISVKEYQSKWNDNTKTVQVESRTLLKGFTWFSVKYINNASYKNMIYYNIRDYSKLQVLDEELIITKPEYDPMFTMETNTSFASTATPTSFIRIPLTKYEELYKLDALIDSVEYIITRD